MFFIIHQDKPIYQLIFNQSDKQIKELFLIHSALDTIQYMMNKRRDYYLGYLKNQELPIFAYINPNQIKFVLVLNGLSSGNSNMANLVNSKKEIDKKVDQQIKQFFNKVNEQLSYVMLNPLYRINQPINSKGFDQKVRKLSNENIRNYITEKKK